MDLESFSAAVVAAILGPVLVAKLLPKDPIGHAHSRSYFVPVLMSVLTLCLSSCLITYLVPVLMPVFDGPSVTAIKKWQQISEMCPHKDIFALTSS